MRHIFTARWHTQGQASEQSFTPAWVEPHCWFLSLVLLTTIPCRCGPRERRKWRHPIHKICNEQHYTLDHMPLPADHWIYWRVPRTRKLFLHWKPRNQIWMWPQSKAAKWILPLSVLCQQREMTVTDQSWCMGNSQYKFMLLALVSPLFVHG